ncbi:MAG: hypothetical protein K8F92_02010 [Hyphomicrobium sp.]|uniref:hypothetical protein n=1 Tax=Hyphomicrobium sp. TaxID=82 RepID=UPI00132ADA67|nr:hypothetical protein [Hyphomicrobium sp.]KAB2942273.1 MAG: hypothetical protein F9K20_06975 [Hyphomicrobium sp.]MBZ0208416.1 hypothetical protein [Hyphomicrobium sp.]MCZ7595587.1 hypothetical protein [Hyphomicrobium sp.]
MEKFAYDAPAEIYSSAGTGARKRPVSYRRFASGAEAIRFTIEELPQMMQRGTVMEVGDDRFEIADIRALYDSEDYPLSRNADEIERG